MIKIFAIDLRTNERFEITDLYFFEEQGIHDFNGDSFYNKYSFEIFVNDVIVYPPAKNTQADVCYICHGEGVITENGRLRTCVNCY